MKYLLMWILKAYRLIISPLYGETCRYYPSCSAYALTAVETHGTVKGAWLALRRLGRCHPWTAGGVDLVPPSGSYRWWGLVESEDDSTVGHSTLQAHQPASPVPAADQIPARQGA